MAIEYKWNFKNFKKNESDIVTEVEFEYMKVVDNKKQITTGLKVSDLNINLSDLTEDNLKTSILSSLNKTEEELQNECFVN